MAVPGNPVYRLFVRNNNAIFLPFFIRKIYVHPVDNVFYLRFPFGEILWMFHHIPGAGHGVYLSLAPFANVFKKWPPLIILNGIFFEPGQYFIRSRFISGHMAFL